MKMSTILVNKNFYSVFLTSLKIYHFLNVLLLVYNSHIPILQMRKLISQVQREVAWNKSTGTLTPKYQLQTSVQMFLCYAQKP